MAIRLALFLVRIQLFSVNLILRMLRSVLYSTIHRPGRILVFRTGSIGDSVCAIPALKSIRSQYPNAHIDLLTHTGGRHLAGFSSLIPGKVYDGLIDYSADSKPELFQTLRKRHYDLVIQLPQVDASFLSLLRDMVFFRGIAKSGWGWSYSQSRWFRKAQNDHWSFPNERDRLGKLLMENQIPYRFGKGPWLDVASKDVEVVKQFLITNNVNLSRSMVALVVGAKRTQNRWPIAHFGAVVKALISDHTVLVTGGKEDEALAHQLNDYGPVVNCCGVFTPLQSAALLSLCTLTISNDTGPMHLSYAVGTPTVALFSNRDLPGKWFPPETGNYVHRATQIPCAGCLSNTCKNNICMQAIRPEEVMDSVGQLLGKGSDHAFKKSVV